ncbi:TPA: hypothetical protein IAC10_14560 [Candidatus Scatousia excrementigallinarum]|uniref:Uncharacterized protein n=1 Tax=Candidatus Scatousia excrementigallinarum TaxID=2840935 RepID=A0A9D1F1Q7_9BACT|nr:hypothetical protein [Candidatus Scatousia excrementigallinarum]
MDIQFISTNEKTENEIETMAKAIEDCDANKLIEITDAEGNTQVFTYNKFLEIFDDYGLEGFALM